MTGQTPFSLKGLDHTIQAVGMLHYEPDCLNGSTDLMHSPDMADAASKLAQAYTASAWAPRPIRIFEKTNLPPGHIIGLRQPVGGEGPYPDTVLVISPSGRSTEVPSEPASIEGVA